MIAIKRTRKREEDHQEMDAVLTKIVAAFGPSEIVALLKAVMLAESESIISSTRSPSGNGVPTRVRRKHLQSSSRMIRMELSFTKFSKACGAIKLIRSTPFDAMAAISLSCVWCNNYICQRYWMTSSARASKLGGTVSPSALAVLRLIASSNLVGS